MANEVAEYIARCMRLAANTAAQCGAYPSWSGAFCKEECERAYKFHDWNGPLKSFRTVTCAELASLTDSELSLLGFEEWGENGLRLIPIYAFNIIADGERLTSISGNIKTKGVDDIDLDVRFGCIAFGFHHKAMAEA